MDMNQNIHDFDYGNYGWEDRECDRDEEEMIRQMEGDDVVPEMQTHQIPLSSGGTSSSQDSSASGSSSSKRAKRVTSRAWDYFEVVWEDQPDGTKTKLAKCKFCASLLTAKPSGGTRHLISHGEKCAKKYSKDPNPMQSQLRFGKDGSVSTWNYDPMVSRESLARLIAACDLPINFGDNEFYEDHIQRSYCPQFKRVSRTTTRSDIKAYYNKRLVALKTEIGSSTFSLALTSDI